MLAVATTLASSHTQPRDNNAKCSLSLHAACSAPDSHVAPQHAVVPLVPPIAVLVFSSMPTLLLASKHRVRSLWAAVSYLCAIWVALLLVAEVFQSVSPSLAYALSLHFSALFLTRRPQTDVLITPTAHAAVRVCALAALVAGAAYAGPPLPVMDSPGVHGCCGAAAHLAAATAAETVGAALLWLLDAGLSVD